MSGRFFESDDDQNVFKPAVVDRPESDRVHDGLTGSDPSGAVTVVVDTDAQVLDVHLAQGWRRTVDPRELHGSVMAAVHAARMRVVADRGSQAAEPVSPPTADGPPPQHLDRPFGREDAVRLLAAARSDLSDYMRNVRDAAKRVTTTHSAGGHVQARGRVGGLTAVDIDVKWARNASGSEIETELRDALVAFSRAASLGELADGPTSAAISELRSVARDPAATLLELARRHAAVTNDSRGKQWG